MRFGEVIALTPCDIHESYINVCKNRVYLKGQGYKTQQSTKTDNGMRKVPIHQNLYNEIQHYLSTIYGLDDDTLIFDVRNSTIKDHMDIACTEVGIKKIRVHDIRHPYVKPMTKNIFCKIRKPKLPKYLIVRVF